MNASTSEPSSECESGWTNYLDESSNSEGDEECHYNNRCAGVEQQQRQQEEKEDDEDLSMISDASSGPTTQQIHEQDNCGKARLSKHRASYLEDTASSTFANPGCLDTKNETLMEHDGESKGKVGFQSEMGLLKMPSSQKSVTSTKQRSGNVKKGCEVAATVCSVVK